MTREHALYRTYYRTNIFVSKSKKKKKKTRILCVLKKIFAAPIREIESNTVSLNDEEKLLKKNSPIYRSFLISFEINIVIRETLLYGNENCNFCFLWYIYLHDKSYNSFFFVEIVKKQ